MDIGRQRSKWGEHTRWIFGINNVLRSWNLSSGKSFIQYVIVIPNSPKGEANGLVLCSFLAQQKSHYIHIT